MRTQLKQPTFFLVVLLTATLGLMACTSSPTRLPIPTPTATHKPSQEILKGKKEMEPARAALEWADKNHSALAEQLLIKTLSAASFIDDSYSIQITENVKTRVRMPKQTGQNNKLFIIPIEVTSTFNTNNPGSEGTYKATLPVSIIIDTSLPMEERATGRHIHTDKFSLEKQ